MKRAAIAVLLCTLTSPLLAQASGSRPPEPMNAAELQLGIDKLGVVGNVLYIAAHPDDENTALLSYLTSERLLRTGYLSITRGDGGQNLIGDEKGPLLGVIRTQELLAARRVDNAEQFFTRAIDFGYSKNPEETFSIWNKEEILSDVVWVIRNFRPDVIITRFPATGEGGHGQHTASAILALEAFEAAADPKRFPDQLLHVEPWKTRRLFWNAWRPQNDPDFDESKHLKIDIGSYNELLGRAYSEIAAESRTMHKSQGFGSAERRGSIPNYFRQLAGDPASKDLFEGIDQSWRRVPGAEKVQQLAQQIAATFNPEAPEKSVALLLDYSDAVAKLPQNVWTREKVRDAADLIRAASGLWIEAIAARPTITSGESVAVTTMIVSRSISPVKVRALTYVDEHGRSVVYAPKNAGEMAPAELNKPLVAEGSITAPADAIVTHPFWLTRVGTPGLFDVARIHDIGSPDDASPFSAEVIVQIAGRDVRFDVPVLYRWTDRVRGEQYRQLAVLPTMTARLARKVLLFPDRKERGVDVEVTNRSTAPHQTEVSLKVPEGWKVSPASVPLTFAAAGERKVARYTVTPPTSESTGALQVLLKNGNGSDPAKTLLEIDYPHIPLQVLLPIAETKLVRADVKRLGDEIGYVTGSGDEIPDALDQMGFKVTPLTDADIESGNLAKYDAIVTGVRAFNTRDVLKRSPERLFDYVKNGGRVVVQYNTLDETLAPKIAPFALKLSRDRVTVEQAPVTMNDDILLKKPNVIRAADFEQWVQERGLYFPGEWGPEFRTLMTMNDPNEKPLQSAVIAAKHGKGEFIYTPISFFRQLPEGVPGAYRLFANLVSNEAAN